MGFLALLPGFLGRDTQIARTPEYECRLRSACTLNQWPANNNNISRLEVVGEDNLDPTATTSFKTDGMVQISQRSQVVPLARELLNNADTGFKQDLVDFLMKPVILTVGTLTTTSTGILETMNLPEDPFSLPVYRKKVTGFLAFRATTVLRLVVNGNPFQQGRLLLHFQPQGGVTGMPTSIRNFDLTTKTQQPGVQLDIGCDSEAILEIPYSSPTSHYNLLDFSGPIGRAFLSTYSALRVGSGSNSLQYTIYCSFKDVELVTPTMSYGTQSGASGPGSGRGKRFASARGRVHNVTDAESEAAGVGPISTFTGKIAKAAGVLSEIPMLSAFTGTAGWVAGVVGRAASVFGYSNPVNQQHAMHMTLGVFPFTNNCDTVDQSFGMGLSMDNKVDILPGFAATDVDEMSFAFLHKVPAFIKGFDWTTSQTTSTLLWSVDLLPGNFVVTYTDSTSGGAEVFHYQTSPPFAFLSTFFQYYRGSIVLTFKLPKTGFHSGRLLLAYCPGYVTANGTPTLTETSFVHREIIDIRECTEFSYTFPFVSTDTYKPVGEAYGSVYLYVLNELTAPSTVSSTIDILVEANAAPDFELAVPIDPPGNAYSSPYVPSGYTLQSGYELQAGPELDAGPCEITSTDEPIGGGNPVGLEVSSSRSCIGELVLSVNQLLKRRMPWPVPTTNATGNRETFRPFSMRWVFFAYPLPLAIPGFWDYVSTLSSMYAYNRGGVRMSAHRTAANAERCVVRLHKATSADDTVLTSAPIAGNGFQSNVFFDLRTNSGVMVQIPHYNQQHSRLVRPFSSGTGSGVDEPLDRYSSREAVDFTWNVIDSEAHYARQASDDFQLGYFVGVPPYLTQWDKIS